MLIQLSLRSVPFGVKTLGAAVGVMITASHNPAQDNGYKLYWSNGIQIISPHDTGIAAAILENLKPAVSWDTSGVRAHDLCENRTEEMKDAYFQHISTLSRTRCVNLDATPVREDDASVDPLLSLALPRTTNPSAPISFVYTAMHGVGTPFLLRAFNDFGFPEPSLCLLQTSPDPNFPTVPFPNPEEKGTSRVPLRYFSPC